MFFGLVVVYAANPFGLPLISTPVAVAELE
jgi:hypothetical protein